MNIEKHIQTYFESLSELKRADMKYLHQRTTQILPKGKLWFLDGKDDKGKVVTNPNIGYGQHTIHYKDGSTKEFYQIGISGNATGISIYIMGIEDKNFLPSNFGTTIGKASLTGYCIKFKSLKDVNIDIVEEAIRSGIEQTNNNQIT
jgi:hypothetical protein